MAIAHRYVEDRSALPIPRRLLQRFDDQGRGSRNDRDGWGLSARGIARSSSIQARHTSLPVLDCKLDLHGGQYLLDELMRNGTNTVTLNPFQSPVALAFRISMLAIDREGRGRREAYDVLFTSLISFLTLVSVRWV